MDDYYDHMTIEGETPEAYRSRTERDLAFLDVCEPSLTTRFDLSDVTPISDTPSA